IGLCQGPPCPRSLATMPIDNGRQRVPQCYPYPNQGVQGSPLPGVLGVSPNTILTPSKGVQGQSPCRGFGGVPQLSPSPLCWGCRGLAPDRWRNPGPSPIAFCAGLRYHPL